jgi:hypothetical protein
MTIKIVTKNAFDRVFHNFLLEVLTKFGFHPSFIIWIKACINHPYIVPLINGRPTRFFQDSIGLRQGFPLSPLLYILMVETLGRFLEHERRNGNIPGIKIIAGVKCLNHSQFADDIHFLGGASLVIARWFKMVLDQFLLVSSGLVNSHKCYIYSWNTNAHSLAIISRILQFPLVSNWRSFKYIGFPIFLNSLSATLIGVL